MSLLRRFRVLIVVVGCWLIVGSARPVSAHAMLIDSSPAPGEVVERAPRDIRLTFNEPVAASEETVIYDRAFRPVADLKIETSDELSPDVVLGLPSLSPGVYTVQWVVVSADGHPQSGTFSFEVTGRGGWPWWVYGLLILPVGLVGVVIMVRQRRPKHRAANDTV